MSNTKHLDSAPVQGARGATEASPEAGRGGKDRWSAKHEIPNLKPCTKG